MSPNSNQKISRSSRKNNHFWYFFLLRVIHFFFTFWTHFLVKATGLTDGVGYLIAQMIGNGWGSAHYIDSSNDRQWMGQCPLEDT